MFEKAISFGGEHYPEGNRSFFGHSGDVFIFGDKGSAEAFDKWCLDSGYATAFKSSSGYLVLAR